MPNPRAQRPLSLQAVTEDIRSLAQPAQAMLDMLAGAAKGSVSATVGLPGDIESLGRGIASAFRAPSGQRLDAFATGMEQPTVLPTTEKVSAKLPAVVPTTAPLSRQHSAGYGQTMGEFIPTPGSGRVVQGGLNAIKSIPAAVQHGAQEFAKASAMGVPHVVKPKGGNWLKDSVERSLGTLKTPMSPNEVAGIEEHFKKIEPFYDLNNPTDVRELANMRQHIEVMKRNESVNNWVERNLTNYVKKEMATPEDPVRKLAEQGILHSPMEEGRYRVPERIKQTRFNADMPVEGMGQSELAKSWEHMSDAMIKPYSVDFLSKAQNKSNRVPLVDQIFEENPWLKNKLPEETVYAVNSDDFRRLGFDHIVDVLREDLTSGRIRPEQLNKVSMEQAVRRAYEYDQEMAKKMAEARVAAREGLPVHKEYPEGYRWVELNKPGAFASESNAMGHSVRGYEPPTGHPDWTISSGDRGNPTYGHGGWEAIKSGNAKVYSLVDPEGKPHVTVEARKQIEQSSPGHWLNQLPPEEQERILNSGIKPGEAPEYQDWLASRPYSITQVKGKQNAAPNEEYLPYVQDFVRGGEWSDVGDLKNTGLRDITRDPKIKEYLEKKGIEVPRYIPEKEYLGHEDSFLMDQLYPPDEGMKRGGKVSISDNPDTMMIDVEDKRYDKGGEIKATPRSEGWGMAADLIKAIEGASKEQFGLKNPATEEIANFLMIPELARTLERKAYGQPITNIGKANVPLIPEDTSGALEAVAPLTGLARKGAKAVGKAAASEIEKAMFGESRVGALNAMTPQVMSVYKPHTPKKPDPDVGTRYKVTDQGGLAPKQDLDIQSLKDSQVKIFPWDATSRNKLVTEVSDIPLTNPVLTEGGDDYMRDLNHIKQRIAGASNYDIANRIMTRINEAAMENQLLGNGTGKVYGFSSRMGEGAEMASTFPTDIALDLIKQAGLKKKELKALDENMRNMNFEGKKGIFQNMAPFGSDEFIHQLRHGLETNKEKKIKGFSAMNMRKAFMDRMSLVENQKRLDYNIQDLANSVLADELKGVPKGYVGNSVAELDAFGKLTPSKSSTYNTDFPGVYAGNMANMPVEILMPKTFENIYREMKHLYPDATKESLRNMAVGAMEKRNKGISEKIGQRNIDAVKTYQEGLKNGEFDPNDIKQVYDYMLRKKLQLKMAGGGEVHGLSTNDLLFLQSQQDIGKMRPQAQREYITNMGGKELRQRMELKRANGGEITADDLTIEERPL
jgi:hypothetical protein